ncbi:hemerythrin domain-containing protein [Roseateles sp. DB2]|uniref:hemerythrin domain-containing protein n=1 Tax=Roseateles sp. DB2 TaxID=3453717 RepID=UPI003EEB9E65
MAQIKFQAPQSQSPEQRFGSSYEQPFELLHACHERVERSLQLLTRLCHHLKVQGLDGSAREAARDIRRYFDVAAPLHHEDEERHVFPVLEQLDDDSLQEVCTRLRDDHQRIHAQWQVLRTLLAQLDSLPDGALPVLQQDMLGRAADAFVDTHKAHLRLENQWVFPSAQHSLSTAQQLAMGQEMAARRGLDLRQPR